MDDLETRKFQHLAAARDLAPDCQGSGAELNAECRTGLGGPNDDDGSLNLPAGRHFAFGKRVVLCRGVALPGRGHDRRIQICPPLAA